MCRRGGKEKRQPGTGKRKKRISSPGLYFHSGRISFYSDLFSFSILGRWPNSRLKTLRKLE